MRGLLSNPIMCLANPNSGRPALINVDSVVTRRVNPPPGHRDLVSAGADREPIQQDGCVIALSLMLRSLAQWVVERSCASTKLDLVSGL
jgi:hypothetical protein